MATAEQLAVLEADRPAWRAALLRLLLDAEEHFVAARNLRGEERDQVLADAQLRPAPVRGGVGAVPRRGVPRGSRASRSATERSEHAGGAAPARTKPSSSPASPSCSSRGNRDGSSPGVAAPARPPPTAKEVMAMLAAAGAPTAAWTEHAPRPAAQRRQGRRVRGDRSARCSAGSSPPAPARSTTPRRRRRRRTTTSKKKDSRRSVRWLGRVAIWAVELAARGAMVPLLRQRRRRSGAHALLERLLLGALDAGARRRATACNDVADAMPGSVARPRSERRRPGA